jgi:FkbM family methyltransferase
MKNILKSLFKLIGYQISRDSPEIEKCYQKKSYSQCGEDLIVRYIFNLRGIFSPSYIDIGANNPFKINNTAIFYNQGSRGINIEANPNLLSDFEKHRPDDINLNIGVGEKEALLDFYIMDDDTLSTFSTEEYNSFIKHGKQLKEIKKITVLPVIRILDQYNNGLFPDFLSLDVEGVDLMILKTINFEKSAPKVICVEAAAYSPFGSGDRRNDIIDFLISKNYYEYANTNLNAIMVKRDFWFTNG